MAVPTKKQFPGFGLPVEYDGGLLFTTFPLAVGRSRWDSNGVCLREQRMLEFVNQITDKPDWEVKVFDEDIVSRWRAEADVPVVRSTSGGLDTDVYLSPQMFDFCIAELRDKSEQFKQTGCVKVLDAELVVAKSDRAISRETQEELRIGVAALENVPDHQKDWHPGSEGVVLDLVHPSLFPVVWGFTRALEEGTVPLDTCASYTGKGVLVASRTDTPPEAPPWGGPPPQLWGSFQWLPAQVELAADGSANITSYINNLHPTEHKALYGTLERIVAATVPLWEDALNGFRDRRRFDLRNTGSEDFIFPPGLKYQIPGRQGAKSLYNPVTGKCEDAEGERGAEADNDENDDDDDDDVDVEEEDWRWDEDFFDWERSNRVLVYREPRDYVPHTELVKREESTGNATFKTISLRDSFPDGLQVIFKLANILLTPEHPSYEGGSWHVEGTLNEMICASAIYYYDQDNITDSNLAFRQHMSAEEIMMIPEQGEYESLERYLGVEQNGPAMQHLGQVLTKEGRLLVFPNCLQHQVQPFELQDKSRGGHRKILAMFLVDPHRPILSSAHVPPQRRDWWAAEVHRQGGLSALPNELADLVMNEVDGFPVSWEQACGLRERLMDERRGINEGLTDLSRQETFSFCEH